MDFNAYWQLKAHIIAWQFIVEYIKKSFTRSFQRKRKKAESWNVRAHERQQTIPRNGIECRTWNMNIKNQWRPVKEECLNEKYAAIEQIIDHAGTNNNKKTARRFKKTISSKGSRKSKRGTSDNRESKWLQVCNEYMKNSFTTKDENLTRIKQ